MKKYAVGILFQKHTNEPGKHITENKVRLFFADANNVDEAVGKVINNEIDIDLEGFAIAAWQATNVPKDTDSNETD